MIVSQVGSAARAAQQQREGVPLLAGQRRSGIDQLFDVGIQAALTVLCGAPVVVVSFLLLAGRDRERAGPGWSRTGRLAARPAPHRGALSAAVLVPSARMI
jgi:hypothetical protein